MRTENLAIAYIDIAGFTQLTASQSREENERMLRRFDSVVRPAVRGFNGRVVKTVGDAYLLTFRSPTNALLCAMAIHDRLYESNLEVLEKESFQIRAAINLGEVRVEGGDVFGEAVNVASRIESQTPTSEIYFSEAVCLAMTRAEVPRQEVGYAELKGIEHKTRLYRIPKAAEDDGRCLVVDGTDNTPARTDLPYGGYALARLRERGPAFEGVGKALGAVIETTRPRIRSTGVRLRQLWWSFATRFRESRRFRIVTLLVAAAIIITLIVIIAWPKSRPLTGWEKFKRDVGI
jgi:class 3 adenylate cyclase